MPSTSRDQLLIGYTLRIAKLTTFTLYVHARTLRYILQVHSHHIVSHSKYTF
jgi:hypothetical protein